VYFELKITELFDARGTEVALQHIFSHFSKLVILQS